MECFAIIKTAMSFLSWKNKIKINWNIVLFQNLNYKKFKLFMDM